MTPVFVALAIAALAVVAGLAFVRRGDGRARLSPLAGLSMAFVVAGIVFGGDERLLGYSLMGVGITLAVIDIVRRRPTEDGPK
jgi:hypothetical protein